MLVLAIDTTSERGGVELYRDHDCLASASDLGSSGYSVTLFHAVNRVLTEASAKTAGSPLTLRDIELFAVATGPGSFTGIRTGLAATQGWATALGRPVQGVSILAAMAHQAQLKTGCVATIMDARRGEFYLGVFVLQSGGDHRLLKPQGESMVLKPEALRTFLEERLNSGAEITCVIREDDEAAQTLQRNLPAALSRKNVSSNLLGSIARLALEAHRQGMVQSPAELDACYIRRSDAELNWHLSGVK